MSYDYDYMIADYEEDSLILVIGHNYYEYELSQHKDLFEGGKENGVDYEERGHPEDTEDLEDMDKGMYWSDEEGNIYEDAFRWREW